MRANIKLHVWIPFLFVLVIAFFLMQEFNVLDFVMIIGGLIIVGYFAMGFIKRKDALVIEGKTMKVTTPIKKREYNIPEITEIFYHPKDKGIIQATYQNETINLVTNIYDEEIEDIYAYLVSHYEHITSK